MLHPDQGTKIRMHMHNVMLSQNGSMAGWQDSRMAGWKRLARLEKWIIQHSKKDIVPLTKTFVM